jgi:hypothetical protein
MKIPYPAMIAACTLLSVRAMACELPTVPQIPGEDDLEPGPAAQQIALEVQDYFLAMQTYTECVVAELDSAGGDNAPQPLRRLLIARNNAAIAEAEAVQKLWNDRAESAGLTAQ